MNIKQNLRKGLEAGIGFVAITTLVLAGCGGGSSSSTGNAGGSTSTSATITPYKGMFMAGATVVVKDANGNPVSLTSGGTVNASGVVSVTYAANVTYPLIVEVSGSYYNEVTGLTETTATPIRGLITNAAGAANVPVTIVTEAAVADLQNRLGSFAAAHPIPAASAVAALNAAGTLFGVPASAVPAFDPATNKTSDSNTLLLSAWAVTANAQSGVTLADRVRALANSLIGASGVAPNTHQTAFNAALTSMTSGASSVMAASATPPATPTLSASIFSTHYASAVAATGGTLPTITGFSPNSGTAGTTVTIVGTNFDPDPFHMQVSFGGNVAATIVSSSSTQLVVTVPAGASTGKIKVTNGLTLANVLSASNFTVTGSAPSNTWTQRSSGSAFILNTVTYGNGLFLAGGMGYTILSSPDGITWTSRSSSSNKQPDANYYSVNSLAWSSASNLFIAVGDGGSPNPPLLATSPDGITWTRASLAADTYSGSWLSDVTADSNGITAVGQGYIFYSTDGSTWSRQAIPSGMSATLGIAGVASSGATRVAVGHDSTSSPADFILVSTNASSWSSVTVPAGFAPQDVVWNGSLFVAVGSNTPVQVGATPQIATSTDGQSWALQTLPATVASSSYMLNDIAWDGARFIAVGSPYALANSRLILSSTDGSTWAVEQQITTGMGQKVLNSIVSNGTLAVAVGDSVFTNP
jgi:hypothetical protein